MLPYLRVHDKVLIAISAVTLPHLTLKLIAITLSYTFCIRNLKFTIFLAVLMFASHGALDIHFRFKKSSLSGLIREHL